MTIFAEVKGKGSIHTVVSAVSSALLILWYLLAVSGLDVHADSEHGEVYVVSSLSGGNCERIHPHEHCHDEASGDEHACGFGEECCSDVFAAVLSLTGGNSGRPDLTAPVFSLVSFAWCPAVFTETGPSWSVRTFASPPDIKGSLSKLCVFRV